MAKAQRGPAPDCVLRLGHSIQVYLTAAGQTARRDFLSRRMNDKNAIVIGALSGIGRELAKILSRHGYAVGILALRLELLSELAKELPNRSFVRRIDLANQHEAAGILEGLIQEMGQVHIIVVNAGVGFLNPDLDWEKEKATIDVNVLACRIT